MPIVSPKQAYEYAYDKGVLFPNDWYITKNFKWNEVFTNECKQDGIPMYEVFQNAYEIGQYIQQLRNEINKPINVHCWVRQIPHNKRAGSTAKYSAHINGCAIDFSVTGVSDSQIRALLLAMKLPIRIEANTKGWIHIDRTKYIPFKQGLFYV